MKIAQRFIGVLLTSAALGFAQLGVTTSPAEPNQGAIQSNAMTQPPPAFVGPGTVNYIEGQVTLGGQSLSQGSVGVTKLNPGEAITTADGYVELLLTPGAFLRVGQNCVVRLTSAGLA
jgi:hypothetical protein